MQSTTVHVDLGGSPIGESMTIVVTGAPCRLKKALPDVVAALKGHRQAGLAEDAKAKAVKTKPCGCKDA